MICPGGTEETSEYDFHDVDGNGRASVRWTRLCEALLGTTEVLLMEVFFWSSRDQVEFKERFGPLEASPHPEFCTRMNRLLLEHYSPQAVICPGLGTIPVAEAQYGLTHCDEPPVRNNAGHRLVETRSDGQRLWVFTKHWTGARLSRQEKELIQKSIASIVKGRNVLHPD